MNEPCTQYLKGMNNNLPMQYVYNGLAEIHFRGQRHKVKNYQEWHRAAFTISVGLKHFGIINLHQYKLAEVVLPAELFDGCDGLLVVTEKEFFAFEEEYGRPDKMLSYLQNDLVEHFERLSRSEGVRKNISAEYYYKDILQELGRFNAVMRDQPPISEYVGGFKFKEKEY